tara:strand:- start:176 stop:739 length:564 start_codon:yes stop_codon:yes gene_type:complete
MKQKFKRGNLVRIAKELGSTMKHFKNDKDAIIVGSYSDLWGGSGNNKYAIMFEDGNTSSWYEESQLTLLGKGGEHLLEEAQNRGNKISKNNTDFNFIVNEIDEGNVSSETILFLFEKFGFNTSFNRNGEFYVLFRDWNYLQPIFKYIKNAESLEDAKSCLTEEGSNKFNVELIYNEFKNALAKNNTN